MLSVTASERSTTLRIPTSFSSLSKGRHGGSGCGDPREPLTVLFHVPVGRSHLREEGRPKVRPNAEGFPLPAPGAGPRHYSPPHFYLSNKWSCAVSAPLRRDVKLRARCR